MPTISQPRASRQLQSYKIRKWLKAVARVAEYGAASPNPRESAAAVLLIARDLSSIGERSPVQEHAA